jgi:S1-C subfamily serine protease
MKLISNLLMLALAMLFSCLLGISASGATTETTAAKGRSHAEFEKLLAAAEKGDANAQYEVGTAYDMPYMHWGGVVDEDVIEAEKWYRKAAEQGLAWAQNGLASLYLGRRNFRDHRALQENYPEALKWFRKAAEQGDSCGQSNLGHLYLRGDEFGYIAKDKVQAYKWLTLAARSSAQEEFKESTESEIAGLAGTMNPQQTALAERYVREFLARANQTKGGEKHDQAGDEPLKASGSGFFITDDGALLTNFHVVDGASRIVVNTKHGSFPAKVVKLDSANDIAIIKVSGSAFKSLPMIPSRGAKLADSVFTIGFPNPEMQGTEPKFTDGKISSLSGAQDDARYFQISVAVQPGNSGGPLVNSAGSVVGIVTARLSDRVALAVSGALPQNVNYALKSSYVLLLLESIPELAGKLKAPQSPKERKLDEVVKEAQEAVAQVLVY